MKSGLSPRQSLGQQLRLRQAPRLTLRQQQSIRLLQLSSTELQAEILAKLESNIMLELDSEAAGAKADAPEDATSPEQDTGLSSLAQPLDGSNDGSNGADTLTPGASEADLVQQLDGNGNGLGELDLDIDWEGLYENDPVPSAEPSARKEVWEYRDVSAPSLHAHLLEQLQVMPLPDHERTLAATVIQALDEDGFLRSAPEELWEEELSPNQLEKILDVVQSMEPPGVGARDLQECLLLQLRECPEDTPALEAAQRILREAGLADLQGQQRSRLAKKLGLAAEEVETALTLLQGLSPRPGKLFDNRAVEYVTPDLFLEQTSQGAWQVRLNEDLYPGLRINPYYRQLLRRRARQVASQQALLRDHLQEAKWLRHALQNRGHTLRRVAECIVSHQADFFRQGGGELRPLVLRQVAEVLKMHVSTVSRAVSGKYMQTPRGTFELRYFFSSALPSEQGGVCSSRQVCNCLEKLVRAEDPGQPLSDKKIVELLSAQGISVARRTVAKYRNMLRIPPASQRRQRPIA